MLFTEQLPVLAHLKFKGFEPKTIIDCGSHTGKWSRMIQFLYPDIPIHLIDILNIRGYEGEKPDSDIKNGVNHYFALDDKEGEKILYHSEVYPELTTIYKDMWNPEGVFIPIRVPTTTLDKMFEKEQLDSPILLKMDIQGAELPALNGATNVILPKTDVVIIEASYHNTNEGGFSFREAINGLHDMGFELFEVVKCDSRNVYGPLFQCDAFFVSNRMNYLWQK